MRRHIVAVIIASIVATTSNALELKNAVVLDHKTSITHGLVGGFVETDNQKKSPSYGSATATARAYNSRGRINDYLRLNSSHGISIENHTKNSQYFTYEYKLKTDDYKEISQTYHLKIDANGYARDSGDMFLNVQYTNPGSHRMTAETSISGDASTNNSDYASIDVRK